MTIREIISKKMNNTKKIIIVEDEKDWRDRLENILKKSKLSDKLDISTFSSYDDSSEWFIKNRDYDLVIVDLELNEGDRVGLKFSQLLIAPIIIVSGHPITAAFWLKNDEKVIGYFGKDNFDKLEFITCVEKIFDISNNKKMTKKDYYNPNVFISYSWEEDSHNTWVKLFAEKLINDGINAKLDKWDLVPGDQITDFMEKSVRENDFVLVLCTPKYKEKSDNRKGGVGYEGNIMTAEIFSKKNHRKFIPILKSGSWENAAPSWLLGKYYIDLSNQKSYNAHYPILLAALLKKSDSKIDRSD